MMYSPKVRFYSVLERPDKKKKGKKNEVVTGDIRIGEDPVCSED